MDGIVGSRSAAATVGVTASTSTNGAGPVGALPPLMPEPGNVDIGMVIAKVEVERAFTSRQGARQDRQAAARTMVAAQERQIKAMHRQAEENHNAAIADAWGKMLGGAFSMLGGGVALGTASNSSVSGAWSQMGGAASSASSAGAGFVSAEQKREADHLGADVKAAEMEVTAQKDVLENADDEIKEARSHADKALDFLREFSSAQSKAQSAAIRA